MEKSFLPAIIDVVQRFDCNQLVYLFVFVDVPNFAILVDNVNVNLKTASKRLEISQAKFPR